MAAKQSQVQDTYLAQPPSSSCWLGTIHKGTPRGNLETILDVPTYVATPTPERANGHIVLYFPDVWGMSSNAQLLMDGFADAGFLTLGMDYFRGVRIDQPGDIRSDMKPWVVYAADRGAVKTHKVLTISFLGPNVQVPPVDE